MRTRLTIMAIVLTAAAGAIRVFILLVIMLGWLGLAIGTLGIMTVLDAYRRWIQPWQHRWGATDEEVHRYDWIDNDGQPALTTSFPSCNSSRWATRS